jgi:thymidylate kinase
LSAASIVDAAAGERVLVFGSLPPDGRDLDLLARPGAERAVAAALLDAGFLRRGVEWVRFSGCSASGVDLVPAADWRLPEPEVADLFQRATPVGGFANLAEPAPDHQLLIVATRLLPGGKGLTAGRRARVERALEVDPEAWERARERAGAWGGPDALERLRAALGPPRPQSRAAAARTKAWRLRNARVVAFSGVDGSGKSTHAKALAATLEQLGYEAAIVWTPLASDAWLDVIAVPIKRLLGRLQRRPTAAAAGAEPRGIVPNPGSDLRGRSRLVNAAWATLVALGNGVAHARLAAGHLAAGRVVIFDRYLLDSVVRLRFLYGERSRYRLQRGVIRRLSPRPLASFFLDVSAETSLARKEDRWAADELATQVRLYREEYEAAGVTRLDGTRSPDDLCAEIAEAVWRRLD